MPTIIQTITSSLHTLSFLSPSPRLDIELLLAHVLKCDRLVLIRDAHKELTVEETDVFERLLARRLRGEPVAYIIGVKEFYGRQFNVTPSVLIPRPETEHLVEQSLKRIELMRDRNSRGEKEAMRILDLGTGSGCIAVSLALEIQARGHMTKIVAVDLSEEALIVARQNAEMLGASALIDFRSGSWFEPIENEEIFDVIVSNPPYVAEADKGTLACELSYEPQGALFAEELGLADIFEILRKSPQFLAPQGSLLCEIGDGQGSDILTMIRSENLCYTEGQIIRDLSGRERVLSIQRG